MMVPTGWLGGHPETGELLCFADRSLSAVEHGQLAAHITECEHCQRELALLDAQARSVSAAMATLGSHTVSDIRKAQALVAVRAAAGKVERRRNLRVVWVPRLAAATLALVVGSVMAGPGLALMRTIFVRPPSPIVAAPLIVVPAENASGAPSVYLRSISGTHFAFSFAKLGDGTLEIRRHDSKDVAITMTGPGNVISGPSPVIQNELSGSPSYIVTLPSFVTEITVSVGGRKPLTWKPVTGILYQLKGLAEGQLVKAAPKQKF